MSNPISADRIAENNSNLQPKTTTPTAAPTRIESPPDLPQDTVQISATAQNSPRPATSIQSQLPPTTEILLLQGQGQSMQQIASHFGVSVEQLLNYLSNPTIPAATGS